MMTRSVQRAHDVKHLGGRHPVVARPAFLVLRWTKDRPAEAEQFSIRRANRHRGGLAVPIPRLDGRGLLPVGLHSCTLEEVRDGFCGNVHRRALWDDFLRFLKVLGENNLFFPLSIDGSFVTDKERPSDIDVLVDLRAAPEDLQAKGLYLFAMRHREFRDTYRVDYYPNLPNNPHDFTEFFQYVGVKTAHEKHLNASDRRGILVISQWRLG